MPSTDRTVFSAHNTHVCPKIYIIYINNHDIFKTCVKIPSIVSSAKCEIVTSYSVYIVFIVLFVR